MNRQQFRLFFSLFVDTFYRVRFIAPFSFRTYLRLQHVTILFIWSAFSSVTFFYFQCHRYFQVMNCSRNEHAIQPAIVHCFNVLVMLFLVYYQLKRMHIDCRHNRRSFCFFIFSDPKNKKIHFDGCPLSHIIIYLCIHVIVLRKSSFDLEKCVCAISWHFSSLYREHFWPVDLNSEKGFIAFVS